MEGPRQFSVLVVDDTPANLDLLVEILADRYDVRVALDGTSALEDMARDLPDLVLLDIMMPGMDGYEVCRRMASDPAMGKIPVIFVTAQETVEDEVRGFDCGGVDYITKPVSAPVVLARVATHLALKRAREELAAQNQVLEDNIRLQEEVDRISRHDLKTPLNTIVSLPGILMAEEPHSEDTASALKRIEQAGYTILGMINRSLDLVKMERGTYGLKPGTVDLTTIIQKVLSDLEVEAQTKNCAFLIETDTGDPESPFYIQGEKLLCYSMAANLIKNALEAAPSGSDIGITLSVTQDGSAQLSIHNAGAVPHDIRDNFFEKYATSGKEGGTGLGTYSARLMAKTMKGTISMTTGETEGTRIRVTLPRAEGPVPESRPAPVSQSNTNASAFSPSHMTLPQLSLLIADDDPDNRQILKRFLRHPSLTVETASDGSMAVEAFRTRRHDLIFMDLEMPGMSGTRAMKAIRDLEGEAPERSVPVFALSAHGEDMSRQCREAGFDGFLTKPVRPQDLFGCITVCLDENRAGTGRGTGEETVTVDRDLEDIIPLFMQNKADQIRTLEAGIDRMDFEAVRRTAHKLKGGFNMYGISALGNLCAGIETAAARQETDEIQRMGKELAGRFGRIKIDFT